MLLNCHYYSKALQHNTEITVIIPTPEGNEQITEQGNNGKYDYENGLPVVYLLHGAYGDACSWTRFSSVERYAQAHKLVAVMAGVGNSFYQDMKVGQPYYTFMTEELPAYIKMLFPVSKKREDTYLAGFSMGGYGAWYLGLSKPEQYAKTASMSGALDIVGLYRGDANVADTPFDWNATFGDPDKLEGSDQDLFKLYKDDVKKGIVPKLYQSCGTRDFLYESNKSVYRRFTEMGAEVEYHEEENHMHNWDFWDLDIKRIFDWLIEK